MASGRHGAIGIRVLAALLAFCAACVTPSCQAPLDVESSEVDGRGSIGIRLVNQTVKGVVVYFHGADQAPEVIRDSAKHRALLDPLLRAGYAVVAAEAGGNAYGNPVSRQDYRQLVVAAEIKYAAKATLYVAESMGSLAALALIAEDSAHSIKGMVGITPMMGIPPYLWTGNFIADQWEGRLSGQANPLGWPTQVFAGRNFRLYQAESDQVIPRAATATDFMKRFGAVAKVDVIACQGGHVDSHCYQGADVEKWLGSVG